MKKNQTNQKTVFPKRKTIVSTFFLVNVMALNHSPQQVWLISSFLTWMPTIAREKCKAYYNQESKFVVKKKTNYEKPSRDNA